MKVIAKVSSTTYLCEIQHTEIEKFLGLYYGKLRELQVQQVVDLGKGYDHAAEIASAMRKTQEFVQANQTVVTAILNGLRIESIVATEVIDVEVVT